MGRLIYQETVQLAPPAGWGGRVDTVEARAVHLPHPGKAREEALLARALPTKVEMRITRMVIVFSFRYSEAREEEVITTGMEAAGVGEPF